jgi:hypothetical protein
MSKLKLNTPSSDNDSSSHSPKGVGLAGLRRTPCQTVPSSDHSTRSLVSGYAGRIRFKCHRRSWTRREETRRSSAAKG